MSIVDEVLALCGEAKIKVSTIADVRKNSRAIADHFKNDPEFIKAAKAVSLDPSKTWVTVGTSKVLPKKGRTSKRVDNLPRVDIEIQAWDPFYKDYIGVWTLSLKNLQKALK